MSKFGKTLLILFSSATLASAQVIISDNFDRNGNLAGSSPTVGGGTWSVVDYSYELGVSTFTTTSAGQANSAKPATAGNDNGSLYGVLQIPSAYLGSGGSLIDGVYTLSVTMSSPNYDGEGVFLSLGNITASGNAWDAGNNVLGLANIGINGPSDTDNVTIYQGPWLHTSDLAGTVTPGAATNVALTFDVSNEAHWTLSATINGTPVLFGSSTTYTYSEIGDPLLDPSSGGRAAPANEIIMGQYGLDTTGTFQNLEFSRLAVPEPSTWAMMLAGLAFLGFCIRRKSGQFQA